MYRELKNINSDLKKNLGYIEALKKRAIRRELVDDLTLALVDISAACMLEDFKNDDSLTVADRISKKLGKIHAKEAITCRTFSLPSKQFIDTYFASFTEDIIVNNIRKDLQSTDKDSNGFPRAQYLFVKRKFDEIIPACGEEIDCNGEHKIEAHVLRATIYLVMGNYKNAIIDCDAVIQDENVDKKIKVNALIKRANAHQQLQNSEKSFQDFCEAVTLDPTNSDIFYHRGQYYLQVHNLKKAMNDYKKSVSLNPNFAFAYMQKCYTDYRFACITYDDEKMEDVLKSFDEGLEKFPNCAEYYSLYAQILCDRAEYEKADTYFNKALAIEGDNATIHVHKGMLQLEWREDLDQAMKLISQALKIDPHCEFAYETLGTIEIQRGELEAAIELFEKAISLAKSELELEHLFSLRNVALAQLEASKKLDVLLLSEAED